MDLNDLLSRHQISLMRAGTAGCVEAQAAHRGLARGYADRIRALQARTGTGGVLPTPF